MDERAGDLPRKALGTVRQAQVGAGAFVDRQFNTVDVSVVMPVTMISRRYATRFSVAA